MIFFIFLRKYNGNAIVVYLILIQYCYLYISLPYLNWKLFSTVQSAYYYTSSGALDKNRIMNVILFGNKGSN